MPADTVVFVYMYAVFCACMEEVKVVSNNMFLSVCQSDVIVIDLADGKFSCNG